MDKAALYPKHALRAILIIFIIQFVVTLASQGIFRNMAFHPSMITAFLMFFVYKYLPFIPYFIIVTLLCKWLFRKLSIGLTLILVTAFLTYVAYSYLVFGGEFWGIFTLKRSPTFIEWWKTETIHRHFSLATLLGSLYYAWKLFFEINKISNNHIKSGLGVTT
jgi:hypothetical protein